MSVPPTLADRLNHLFATVRPREGREYSNEHVAAAIGREGSVTISQSYIWALRKGSKDNPTMKHLEALARFFGVPVSYFFDDEVTGRVNEQLVRLRMEQHRAHSEADRQVELMAMRAGELSPGRRQQVMDLLEVVHALERAEQDKRGARNENPST